MLAIVLTLLAQATASPSPSAHCRTTEVKLLKQAPGSLPTLQPTHYGSVTVIVDVLVNANGTVKAVKIMRPSGSKAYDEAVIRMLRNSEYAPRTVNCRPVEGSYRWKVLWVNLTHPSASP